MSETSAAVAAPAPTTAPAAGPATSAPAANDSTSAAGPAAGAAANDSGQTPEQVAAAAAPKIEKPGALAAKFARQKAKLASERTNIEKAKAELQAQQPAIQEALKTAEQHKRLMSLVKEDPAAFLAETGLSMNDLTAALLRADTPEAKAAAALSPLEKKLADLEAKVAEKEAQEVAARLSAERRAAMGTFEKTVAEGAYPLTRALSVDMRGDIGRAVATDLIDRVGGLEAIREGRAKPPSFEEVAAEVEAQLAALNPALATPDPDREEFERYKAEKAAKAAKEAAKKPAPKTLTNSAAATVAGGGGRTGRRTKEERFAAGLAAAQRVAGRRG